MTSTLTDTQLAAVRRLLAEHPGLRVLTVRQPWADLIMAGVKDVENRTWPVPQTVAPTDDYGTPLWECPYYRKQAGINEPGVGGYGVGTCSFWCVDEPHCVTGGPLPFPFTLGIHAAKQPGAIAGIAEAWFALSEAWELPIWRDEVTGARLAAEAIERVVGSRLGALLGTVPVTGCHHADECDDSYSAPYQEPGDLTIKSEWVTEFCSRWAEPDVWHWTLADPQPLDVPIPMRGRQRLWRLADELTRQEGKDG